MLFSKVFALPLFVTLSVATTYQDVLNDCTALDSDVKSLDSMIKAYTGSGSQTLAIQNQVNKVENDIDKVTSDVNSATTPTAAQGTSVYNCFCGSLLTDVKTSLNDAVAKKSVIVSAGVKTQFCNDLTTLQSKSDSAANALIAKAPNSDLKSKGTTCKNSYDSAFASAKSGIGC